MDKQLLAALDNLSLGLEKLVEALQQKSDGKQSDTGAALQSGNFGNTLEQISVEIKSIKTDTQEILKNQQTIIELCKQKKDEKKTEGMEGASDPKKESQLKKGVATILLIAVAVLAIGLAFKIVGKVNILSVIALGIGIMLVAFAFERVAKIKGATGGAMTIKEAAITSAIMVIASLGIMVSSWILSKIKPITIQQILTAASIALLFVLVGPAMARLIKAMTTQEEVEFRGMKVKSSSMSFGTVLKAAVMLPLLMVAMSIGIMLSSKFLAQITPISIPKALTAILIGVMFAIVARGIAGLITSLTTSQQASGGGFGFKTSSIGMAKMAAIILGLPLIMFMIAKGIAWSSHALNQIKPIGFMQAITAILIAGMFAVVSLGIAKLINSLEKTNPVAILLLPIAMVAIALAIALSAAIFAKFKSSFDVLGYGTIFKILFLGASISIVAFLMAMATNKLGKLSIKEVLLLPLFLTTMSMALALSAFIFAKPMFKKSFDALSYGTIFKILLLGFAMGVITVIVAFASKFLGKLNLKQVILLPLLFTLMSLAIAVSAFIISKFKSSFDKISIGMIFKLLLYGIVTAIIFVAYAFATKIIGKVLKPVDALKGGLVIIILAGVIMVSSLILNIGKYKNYPSLKWALGVAVSLGAFAIGALTLGSAVFGPQALVFLAGLAAILIVSATIVATSMILNAGKYNKYPTLKWTIGVGAALGAFAIGAIALGLNVINPFFWVGLPMILTVANTVVEVAHILAQGKYNANFGQWAMGVVALYGTFVPIILILGAVGVAAAVMGIFGGPDPFETGRSMLASIAWSIVEVSFILSKGKYKGGPTKEWASGVAIALGAFAPVYQMLVANSILSIFGGGGVGPDDFSKAIKTVSKGIVAAAGYFAKNAAVFKNGPPVAWATGVGKAIGAFAPVFVALNENTGWFSSGKDAVDDMVYGIVAISKGVVAAAEIFAESKASFDGGFPSKKWGKGVGESIKAFAPVFDYMFKNSSGWFSDDAEEVIDQMRYAMVQIAYGIADVAYAINGVEFTSFPNKQWGIGIKTGIESFLQIFDTIWNAGLTTAQFRDLSGRVAQGAASMAMTAAVLYQNRKAFSVKLDPNFIKNISKNIIGFAKLALQLDKMLVSEKTVTSSDSGFFGIGASRSTTKVKVRKDLTLPRDIAIQMATVASIFYKNRKLFSSSVANSVQNWGRSILAPSGSIITYAKTVLLLEKMTGGGFFKQLSKGISSFGFGSYDIVTDYAFRLVRVANIILSGKKAFEMKVDPFFMRKVGQNLIDFTYVVKKIAEIEGKGTTFMGRLGSSFESALGSDPISQTTRKMITLAKGYDAMANALIKLGRALQLLKLKNLSELGYITKQLSTGKFDGDKRVSPVKTKELYTVKDDKKKRLSGDLERKNEILYVSQKMDEVVKLLTAIRKNTNSIDGFIASQGNKPKEPLEIKVDVKTKKDK
jgi:hypothetical protein